jgi:hypothetical protein
MERLNIILNITSWLVAIVSLIIAIVSLRISKRVMILSSRDYVPLIDVDINDENELSIINKDNDLFRVVQVGHIRVDMFGFDDRNQNQAIRIPLVTHSRLRNDFRNETEIIIKSNTSHACAYLSPLPQKEVVEINQRINHCERENSNWYTLPSHRSVIHYVEVICLNKFQEQKAIYLKKKHYHGSGYHQASISEGQFENALSYMEIPEKLSGEELWQHLIQRFRYSYDQYKL